MTPRSIDWLRRYYAATPLFGVADLLFHVPLRVGPFIGAPWARTLYYSLCTAAAVVMYRWPRSSAVIGMVESSANIFILVLGVMMPILSVSIEAIGQGVGPSPLGLSALGNFMLSGTVSVASYHLNAHRLAEQSQRPAA
ncbi:MAG: hypothetical protein IPP68_12175 [Elusimicrobia bacterium]|nr:hypothetical protein [Elusimicrobiota bacterium]